MAIIKLVEKDTDNAEVKKMFDMMERAFGFLPDNFRLAGISPHVLKQLVERGAYLFKESGINPVVFPAIRYRVACAINGEFCINFNSGVLKGMGFTDADLQALGDGEHSAPLSEADNELVSLSAKAVLSPEEYCEADVERLHGHGFSDMQILDAAEHASNLLRMAQLLKAFKV